LKSKAQFYRDCVEWDIITWGRAFYFWEKHATEVGGFLEKKGLEIGANNGGASLFFAQRFGAAMVCSDIENNSNGFRKLHDQYPGGLKIEYKQIDAKAIPYDNETFDFVVFKSVLGIIGARNEHESIEKAIHEIHRVLKPNGILFFAENLRGSQLHQFARKKFVPWGNSWRYISLREMEGLLGCFAEKEIYTTGFFAAFVPRPEWLKTLAAKFDGLLFFIPKRWRYVAYGFAIK
jgi:SAM-dependent methyltransferase